MIKNKYTERLFNEWVQHGKIVIAVDYDDTISPWKFHAPEDLGSFIEIIRLLKECKMTGAYLVIFTSCNPDRYQEIKEYCSNMGLHIDAVNETPVDSIPYGKNGSKVYANIYLDDRAGLSEAVRILENTLYQVRSYRVSQIKHDDIA